MTTVIYKCKYCGAEIYREFKTIREAVLNSRISVYCDDEHRQLYEELKAQKVNDNPEFKYIPPKKPDKKKYPKRRWMDPTMDICAVCRVHNKDCERIQSDFTIIPEGARVNDNGKISECPNFKI